MTRSALVAGRGRGLATAPANVYWDPVEQYVTGVCLEGALDRGEEVRAALYGAWCLYSTKARLATRPEYVLFVAVQTME